MTVQAILEKIKDIPSNVRDEDSEMHLKYLSTLPGNPLLLDFGTGWGKLVISMALACPQAEIYTFDPGTPYQNYIPIVTKVLMDHLGKDLHFEINDSFKHQWDRPLDVLSIDSDHTYKTTLHELQKYVHFVKRGGLILLHDYVVDHVGVKQATDEYFSVVPHEILESKGFTTVIKKL